MVWFTEFSGGVAIAWVCLHFLNIVFGSCWLFLLIAEDIATDVTALNTDVHASNVNCTKLTEDFCNLVRIYSEAKR